LLAVLGGNVGYNRIMSADYKNREYLSVSEVATYTSLSVRQIHGLVKAGEIPAYKSAGGQYRFRLQQIKPFRKISGKKVGARKKTKRKGKDTEIAVNGTVQKIFKADARNIENVPDNSVHLAITSPPYFNAKMYSNKKGSDLGNLHDLDKWLLETEKVWAEVFRVLAPGRKFFLNIMNLPVRTEKSFRTLNLVGRTIELMEEVGFIFKRDIIWHKTNGVKAHFGTYPYPGGILINNMHEFILEFNKPDKKGFSKYAHLTKKQKEISKLDKDFWLSIKNTDVWKMKPENSGDNRSHIAPFPYELPYKIIKAFTYVSETVLDPSMGSGTTAKASADLKRNSVGYEIAPEIATVTINSLKNYQNRLF